MQEKFLHYVWAYQQFNKTNLQSTNSEKIDILKIGNSNSNAGPDFLNSQIKINDLKWIGNVEIHVKSSDWLKHKHSKDNSYDGVILHVVYHNDCQIFNSFGKEIPTLELNGLIPISKLKNFEKLIKSKYYFACQKQFGSVDPIVKIQMIDNAISERAKRKSHEIIELLEKKKGDWESTAFSIIGKNFGFKLNSEAFFNLCNNIDPSFLKNKTLKTIEAILFGFAGFLEICNDQYSKELKVEFEFICQKYRLDASFMNRHQWKFSRTRPSNFPTIRIAQFSSLIAKNPSLFSLLKDFNSLKELKEGLSVEVSSYWQNHYDFGKKSNLVKSKIGAQSLNNLMINSAVPILNSFADYYSDFKFNKKARLLLESVSGEKNNIIRNWESLNLKANSAFDSQALIEQYNELCKPKRCLSCAVGIQILQKDIE